MAEMSADQYAEQFRRGSGPPVVEPDDALVTPRWAEALTRALDDMIRIPGTRIGIGLDGIVGAFLPGAGDAITGVGAVALLVLALRQGVPTLIIARMVLNIAVDALLGTVPVVGDLFDFAWKANRKNLELVERHRGGSHKPGAGDYAIVGVGILMAVMAVLLPILFVILVGSSLSQLF
jgi:hypothetical protein